MKRLIILVLAITISLGSSGCTTSNNRKTPTELWVVTEETTGDGMNYIASELAKQFAEENPESSIRLDVLPTDKTEREAYLESLRVKIGSGDGPDIYLLPATAQLVTDNPLKYSYYHLDSLFPDVVIAMGNRQFADLSQYYDNDKELGKEDLLDIVMDAGIRNGKRYVLPLRFNMSTYVIIPSLLEKTGVSESCFKQDLISCLQKVLDSKNEDLISGIAATYSMGFFSCPIDYETGDVKIRRDGVLRCADLVRGILQQIEYLPPRYSMSAYVYTHHTSSIAPAKIQNLSNYLDSAAIAHAEGIEMNVLPVHSLEGQVTATVTYYAAVDVSCRTPRLAYKYLRMFLSEDAQWETLRRQPSSTQYPSLLEQSFPVRTKGCLSTIWNSYKMQPSKGDRGALPKLRSLAPDEAVIDSLTEQIDQVNFITDLVSSLDTVLTANNVEESFDNWLAELQFSLAEG